MVSSFFFVIISDCFRNLHDELSGGWDASTKGVRAIAQAGKMGIFCFLKKED
jgi:hypothetical protein